MAMRTRHRLAPQKQSTEVEHREKTPLYDVKATAHGHGRRQHLLHLSSCSAFKPWRSLTPHLQIGLVADPPACLPGICSFASSNSVMLLA